MAALITNFFWDILLFLASIRREILKKCNYMIWLMSIVRWRGVKDMDLHGVQILNN